MRRRARVVACDSPHRSSWSSCSRFRARSSGRPDRPVEPAGAIWRALRHRCDAPAGVSGPVRSSGYADPGGSDADRLGIAGGGIRRERCRLAPDGSRHRPAAAASRSCRAWVVAFVLAFGELGASILVAPPGEATLPIRIYTIIANTPSSNVAMLALLQSAVIFLPVAAFGAVASMREVQVKQRRLRLPTSRSDSDPTWRWTASPSRCCPARQPSCSDRAGAARRRCSGSSPD